MFSKLFGKFYDGAHAGQLGFGGFIPGDPAREGGENSYAISFWAAFSAVVST